MDHTVDRGKARICGHLSSVPFEQLLTLKASLGTKTYIDAIFDETGLEKHDPPITKRTNKNRPREISSKCPLPAVNRTGIPKNSSTGQHRDPRFDERCGAFDNNNFKTNYEFVNEIRKKDIKEMKRAAKRAVGIEKKELKLVVQKFENQYREEEKRKGRLESIREEKTAARREGKKIWYKNKNAQRFDDLIRKYEELKKSGGLDKHIEKRRKKNKSNDRRKITID